MTDFFRFRNLHRTMAEVLETEALEAKRRIARLSSGETKRLDALLNRADINNPPPIKKPDDAA
jgi:hypothetical protein